MQNTPVFRLGIFLWRFTQIKQIGVAPPVFRLGVFFTVPLWQFTQIKQIGVARHVFPQSSGLLRAIVRTLLSYLFYSPAKGITLKSLGEPDRVVLEVFEPSRTGTHTQTHKRKKYRHTKEILKATRPRFCLKSW